MTDWKLAMCLIVPLMWGGAKPRTWAAIMAGSLLAMLRGALDPAVNIVIDVVCGALVLTRPMGLAQKCIGIIFAGMALFDVGFVLSPQMDGGASYYQSLVFLGWVQFAILAVWGVNDSGKMLIRRLWLDRRPMVIGARIR